jgi:hypothetical protein
MYAFHDPDLRQCPFISAVVFPAGNYLQRIVLLSGDFVYPAHGTTADIGYFSQSSIFFGYYVLEIFRFFSPAIRTGRKSV